MRVKPRLMYTVLGDVAHVGSMNSAPVKCLFVALSVEGNKTADLFISASIEVRKALLQALQAIGTFRVQLKNTTSTNKNRTLVIHNLHTTPRKTFSQLQLRQAYVGHCLDSVGKGHFDV